MTTNVEQLVKCLLGTTLIAVRAVEPSACYIVGSAAKGISDSMSDIDVLVVSSEISCDLLSVLGENCVNPNTEFASVTVKADGNIESPEITLKDVLLREAGKNIPNRPGDSELHICGQHCALRRH